MVVYKDVISQSLAFCKRYDNDVKDMTLM